MDKRQNTRFIIRQILIYAMIMAFFIGVIIVYYHMIYNETKENIINAGRINAIETANMVDKTLSSHIDILRLASYSLDNMIRDERTNEEILDYLVNETIAFRDSMNSDTTGIYGYINGVYMDGSGWIPEEGYDPTDRPWYTQSKTGSGKIVLGDPYLDLDTGTYTIAVGKTLCDTKSVVAVDLFIDQLRKIIDEHSGKTDIYSEIIINVRGEIITHSDKGRIGSMIFASTDPLDKAITEHYDRNTESFFYFNNDGRDYMVYILPLQYSLASITVIDASDDINRLMIPLSITIITSFIIVLLLAFFMISSDRRRREAQALAVQSERATAANEAKSEFLSNMSHEIRTPINAILGMNEMVLRVSEDKEILEYSNSIKKAGRTLLGIVNDILDFSKIEAGKMEIIPVEYELDSLLNDLVTMTGIRVENKGLTLQLEFDKDTPKSLFGDAGRIKQVITNLLTNAVKYTDSGSVTFGVGFERIVTEKDAINLRVYVKDTGIGIKKEDMHKLFSKFERIEENRHRNIEGTGLGMSITMNLIRMMGSELEVESIYGQGSCFGFRIKQSVIAWTPLGDYESSYREKLSKKRKYKEKFTAPDARVLVVDDNPMNLVVFENLVKLTGVTVDTGSSGDEGIRLSEKLKYDMVFLDHMMPEKDGIETLNEIRDNDNDLNHETPFICLTANAISGAREKYLSAGFDDYLTKPIDPEKLEEMMISYLPEEKVIINTFSNGKEDEEEMLSGDLASLSASGINVEKGLKNSGDARSYRSLLKIFYESAEEKSKEISDLYNSGDYKNYTIKVHALKSSARIIGAEGLGEEAQKLEDAGKNGDISYIREHQEEFLKGYHHYKRLLKALFDSGNENSEKPEADEAMMSGAFNDLKTAAENMDCDMLDSVFSKMESYSIPEKYREKYKGLRGAADQYQYDRVLEILGEEDPSLRSG